MPRKCKILSALVGEEPTIKVRVLEEGEHPPVGYVRAEKDDSILSVRDTQLLVCGDQYYINPSDILLIPNVPWTLRKSYKDIYIGHPNCKQAAYIKKIFEGKEIYDADSTHIDYVGELGVPRLEYELKALDPNRYSRKSLYLTEEQEKALAPLLLKSEAPDLDRHLRDLSDSGIDLYTGELYSFPIVKKNYSLLGKFSYQAGDTPPKYREFLGLYQLSKRLGQQLEVEITEQFNVRHSDTVIATKSVDMSLVSGIKKDNSTYKVYVDLTLKGIYPSEPIQFSKDIVQDGYIIPAYHRKNSEYTYIDARNWSGAYSPLKYPEDSDRVVTLYTPSRYMCKKQISRRLLSQTKLKEKCPHIPELFYQQHMPQSKMLEWNNKVEEALRGGSYCPLSLDKATNLPQKEINIIHENEDLIFWGAYLLLTYIVPKYDDQKVLYNAMSAYLSDIAEVSKGSKYLNRYYIVDVVNIDVDIIYKVVRQILQIDETEIPASWRILYAPQPMRHMRALQMARI